MSGVRGKKRGAFPSGIHPVWRGIGCLFIFIVPIISLGLADTLLALVDEPLPVVLAETVTIPGFGEVDNFLGRLLFTGVLSIAVFLVISIVASIFYELLGGHRNEDLARFTKRYPRDR